MFLFPKDITKIFYSIIHDEMDLDKIEEWILYNWDLEKVLGEEVYQKFYSFRYSLWETMTEIKDYINILYEKSKFGLEKETIIYLLLDMINGCVDLAVGCSQLASCRSFNEYIPIEYVGIDSMIDDTLYHYKTEKDEKDRIIGLYKGQILNLTRDFLRQLGVNDDFKGAPSVDAL